MTCETARLLSLFNRPGDLSAEDAQALAAHCAGCTVCVARPATDDAALATAMRAVALPVGFKDSLLTNALRTKAGMIRCWWAGRLATAGAMATAACLMLGTVAMIARPTVDGDALLASFDPEALPSRSADFDLWRQSIGLPLLPEDFDLNLVSFTGELVLEGRRVPAVRFTTGFRQEALAYFVRDTRFNLVNAENNVGSTGTIRVYRNQPGGWTVIVLHTGTSLQPFLNRGGNNT
jgi:hypothetical protein